jgi:exodeoxyribonuclease-3
MNEAPDRLEILTMNVGNPSRERAERQLEWLAGRSEDVLVLTETAPSRGCALLAERLAAARWEIRLPPLVEGERGVMIASRAALEDRDGDLLSYLPARAERATLAGGLVQIIGAYVPSRDGTAVKTNRKRTFIDALTSALGPGAPPSGVLIGDLNIIEPGHRPRYAWFQNWEYEFYRDLLHAGWVDAYRLRSPAAIEHSWVGYEGDGYRYDHTFVSAELAGRILNCAYIHETRELAITDHSAMTLALALAGAQRLNVGEPLSGERATLF